MPDPGLLSGFQGGVIMGAHLAIVAYFDTLGPARGPYAGAPFTDWDDTYRYQVCQGEIVQSDKAIIDASLPAVDVTPTDPGGTTVPLLVPQDVRVVIP